jgi:hypothetical protein
MEAEAIKPALDVFTGVPYVSPGKLLIICSIAVFFQARLNERPLFFRKPADILRVIRDEPVCYNSNDNSEEALLRLC